MSRGFAHLVQQSGGAVLVEFALTLPLLLFVIVGIFDFGIAFQKYGVVTNAAREGARMAVLPGAYSTGDIESRVRGYLTAGGIAATPTILVADDLIIPEGGAMPFTAKKVTVQIAHTFTYLVPFARIFGGTFGTVTLKAVSEMRTEVAAGNP